MTMICSIIKDPVSDRILGVNAPNGEPSLLYRAALEAFEQNPDKALLAWSTAYTPEFIQRYGDWQNGVSTVTLDENGEPTPDVVFMSTNDISAIVKEMYPRRNPIGQGSMLTSRAQKLKETLEKRIPGAKFELIYSNAEPGYARVVPVPSIKRFTKTRTAAEIRKDKAVINPMMDAMMPKFKGLSYVWVKPGDLRQGGHYVDIAGINAFVRNNVIYLVEGRVTPESAMEEVAHVFIEFLRQDRPALFTGLVNALLNDPKYSDEYNIISSAVKSNPEILRANQEKHIKSEFLARNLGKMLKRELEQNPQGRPTSPLGKLIERFFEWLSSLLNNNFVNGETTLREIASYINTRDMMMDVPIDPYMYYNEEGQPTFDPNDRDVTDIIGKPAEQKKTAQERNIERGKEGLEKLKNIREFVIKTMIAGKNRTNMLATVDKLIENAQWGIEQLEAGRKSISITKYKGSDDFVSKNTLGTETGAKFGTFYHQLIEDIQQMYMDKTRSPLELYTREWFNEFFEKNKDLLENIKKIDMDMLFNIGQQIVSSVNKEIVQENILLPEITVMGEDIEGTLVLGRLDIMSMNKEGKIKVIDLKTANAVFNLKSPMAFPHRTFDSAFTNKNGWKDGVSPLFRDILSRTKLETYQMQTELYSEILNKMGIDVFGQEIIAIAYEMVASGNQQTETATSFEIKNYSVFEYNDQHYYATVDRFGNVRSNSQAQAIRDAARQSFRATEQIAEEKIEEESKTNPFALIDANTRKAMILKLIEVVKENMAGVSKQYDEINKNLVMDPNTKNIEKSKLDRRKASLTSILSRLEVETFGEQPAEVALAQAIVMKTALDVLSKEIEVITSEVNALDIPQIYELGSEANKTILSTLHNYMVNLDAMQNYIEGFKNTVVSSPGLTEDQIKDLGAYFDNISRLMLAPEVKSYELSKNVTKAILKKIMGSSNNELGSKFAKVFGDVKKVLGPRLDWINRTIAEIEQGKTTNNTLSYRVMRSLGNLFSSDKNQTDRLTALKEEAKKISKLMEINELTDEVLDDYLTALIDNRESAFYMGQTMKGGDFNVVQISDIIGSSADSEMIVSAMFQYMRNISEQARIEALRWADELDIDNLKSAFIASMGGIQAANRAISEEVEVPLEFDINGDVTSSQMERKFLGPVSQEFKNIHMRYRDKQRKYSEQVKEMMKQVRDEANAERKETLKKELKRLEDEAQAHNREYTEWRIENEETDIKPDVLRLMHASGAANDMISNIYMQMQQILFAAGGEENLTEDQQDQIDALHADVSRIRAEAIEADPTIKEKLDQLTEYFEYDPNFVLWTIRREGIQKEGNAKKLQTWDNNNTDRVPTEEFNNRIDRLYEAIANIKGEMDSQLAALYAERRLIKSKAKVRGVFNFNYLTNEDIARYNEVENAIQARLEELKEDNEMLEEEDRRRYAQLMSELKGIRIQVLDPRYKQKYDMLRKNVKTAYNLVASLEKEKAANYADRSIDAKIADAKQQYERKEQEFKAFFDQHNKTKYELGQNLIGENKAFKEQPNAYLFVYMPKDPNDMELVPNNKYRIKRLKQSAYNEKYQASFEMQENSSRFYAMPKGIRFNYATNEFEISSNAKWANPRFVEMQKNKTANEFYKKWVIENFILKQRDAVGRPLGFNYPFVQQLGLENVISKGMKGVAREYQEKLQEVTYNTSELEKATNESGLTGQQKVVFKENYKVAADLTTTNGIESIVNWNAGFYANKKMAMLGLEMSSVLTFLKNIEKNITGKTQEETDGRKRMIKTIIDQIEYNKNKFVYGQIFEKRIDGESNAIFNRKTMRIMMQVASFGRMAFDIPMQFGNLLSGNVQAFLSTSSSRHATQMNYINAKRLLYTRWMPRLLADWGKISGASFETKLFRYMNPLSKNLDRMFEANTVSKMRRLANRVFNVSDISMGLQDKGEVEIGLTVMLMVLDNRRYEVFETDSQGNIVIENGVKKLKKDANGSQVYVNGIEAFGLNEQNTIAPKNNVNISEQEIDDLRSLIMGEIYTFQGNYATYTKSKFGSTKLGTLYEFYRKYLIPAVGARFRIGGHEGIGSMYSWDTGEAYTGWYVALGKMFKYYGWQKASATLLYDTLVPGMIKNRMNINTGIEAGDYYRMRSAMAGREILLAVLFYMLYQALRSALYDGDEDDYNYLELSMMRTLVKVSNESRSMVPMIIVGKPGDYIDNFGSLTSAFREGKTVWDLGTNGFWYVDYQLTGSTHAFERGFYQRDTDRFEEGDAKVTKNFYDLTGISNIIDTYYPYEAAKRQLKQK